MKNEWINGMRISILFIIIIVLSIFLNGSGCTKIDTPIRTDSDEPGSPDGESQEDLFIIPDKYEILDTEPTRIQAQGGTGDISWKTEPPFEDLFLPETGKLVLFSPPDVSGDTIFTIVAYDDNNETAKTDILIIDEGMPPEPGDILINEIAWAGTLKTWRDEYIELINKTGRTFYLDNWSVENAGGTGISFFFSGKIGPGALFLISNYDQGSENTAISAPIDYADSSLSMPNSTFGPFVLKNYENIIFDTAGDGGAYIHGTNTSELKSSMSRYTYSTSIEWDAGSWYTESVSINLLDETCGTPGEDNSDESGGSGTSDYDAQAIITEYSIDAGEEISKYWVELYITKSGSIRNFLVTDLDGTDLPVTGGEDIEVTEGQYILIIWEGTDDEPYSHEGDRFYIPDYHPTGTKDELVLLCAGDFLDGLCYYSTEEIQFDDEVTIQSYGWSGDPIYGKHASRKMDGTGYYLNDLQAASWDTGASPTPGYINN